MSFHIFKFRFKAMFRQKEILFWNALFPILLCTCFVVAFSNISKKEWGFKSIPVAVVYEKEDAAFKTVLEAVASDDSQGDEFLNVTVTDLTDAKELLENEDIEVIIRVNDKIDMIVANNGLNQTAVKSFIQQYELKQSMVKDIMKDHPEKMTEVVSGIMTSVETVRTESLTSTEIDSFSTYYFSLIAMALLFGGMFGMQCAKEMKANTSPVGMRKCVSSAKRGKLIVSEVLASYLIHLMTIVVLLLYMIFVLKINLGNQIGYIALVCVMGSAMGISLGMFIGSFAKLSEGVQSAIFLTVSLGSSFFAGLMVPDIKSWVIHKMPVIMKVNPASLIEDALYSLIVYDTHERFFGNLIILGGITVVLCFASYLMTRRKSYASL